MIKKLILHIGAPKTGSSFIQKSLFVNKELLGEFGILYPDILLWHDNSHHYLSLSLRGLEYGDKKIPTFVKTTKHFLSYLDYARSVFSGDIHHVIISTELLFLNLNAEKPNIKKRLERLFKEFDDILICAFFREPVSYIESTFKQSVKDPNDRTSERPWDYYLKRKTLIFYDQIAQSWIDSFPNIKFKKLIYQKEHLINNVYLDLVQYFLYETIENIPFESLRSLTGLKKKTVNPSMEGAALKLKFHLNPKIDSFEENKLLTQFLMKNFNDKTSNYSVFTSHQRAEIIQDFKTFSPGFYKDFDFDNVMKLDYNFSSVSNSRLKTFYTKLEASGQNHLFESLFMT